MGIEFLCNICLKNKNGILNSNFWFVPWTETSVTDSVKKLFNLKSITVVVGSALSISGAQPSNPPD